MLECDVLIVGGGPAGSSCAWALRDRDLHVVVMDRAEFPRDKTCAGWVTPPVLDMLEVDLENYASARTLQPISSFKTGMLGGATVETQYGEVVSYGIRRCEFDHYLLERCGAQLMTGCPVRSIERKEAGWIVNGDVSARVLIGAGGNFCPVARMFRKSSEAEPPLVTAQEVEFAVDPQVLQDSAFSGDAPALLFCDDFNGYGWCFRKGDYLNIGLGHTDPAHMKRDLARLCDQLRGDGGVATEIPSQMHGHAYRLFASGVPLVPEDGVMLIGDSAGLADMRSGEGIRPAVESGLVAARTLLKAAGDYRRDRLTPYAEWVRRRFQGAASSKPSGPLANRLRSAAGRWLMRSRRFTRSVLLDRWFLHRGEPESLAAD